MKMRKAFSYALPNALPNEYREYNFKLNELLKRGIINAKLMNTEDEQFIPAKKYPSDAGFDCRARVDEPVVIEPGKRAKIPLGFAVNVPMYYTGDLRSRSGLQADYGIMIGYGTVDAGYTGEVKATVFNFGDEPFTIEHGDRIAQLVILPIAKSEYMDINVKLESVDELLSLERGNNGHGSSGVK